MRAPALRLFPDELIVDNFAGGGGASTGIEWALGRSPDIAINHDAEAIAMHQANHPSTRHYCESVWKVDPVEACGGRPVGLAWFSPDCKHFSKAKGGKPVEKKIRGLAWVVIRWAKAVRPRVIILENVEEFQTWGPLLEDGRPCPARKGFTFRRWKASLERLGYRVECEELRACDYGAPTIRKRLFVVARCDGQPIVWPQPTHGKGRPQPWRTAAECIDWSIPCPSIFERDRPLAENTLRRIANGIRRYVLEAAEPFIVPVVHAGDARTYGIHEPFRTITGQRRGEQALVTPFVTVYHPGSPGVAMQQPMPTVTANSFQKRPGGAAPFGLIAPLLTPRYGEREGQEPRARRIDQPIPTIVPTQNGAQLVSAFLAKHYGGVVGADLRDPTPTVTSIDHNAVVASHLVKLKGTAKDGQQLDLPLHTVQAGGLHYGEVRAFLLKYYGADQDPRLELPLATVTSRDRFGLVTIHGHDYVIADIGMRMLAPRELYRAQGFPDDYLIDFEHEGRPLTKTAQVRMCGNSVCPPIAAAIARAQFEEQVEEVAA